jgi:hypothetical protein
VPKYTQGITKVVPGPAFLFDNQRLTYSENQQVLQDTWVSVRNVICPVLVRFQVEAKQFDKAAKQVANVLAQRERRAKKKAEDLEVASWTAQPEPAKEEPKPVEVSVNRKRVQYMLAEAGELDKQVLKRSKRAKQAAKAPKKGGEYNLDTIDVTPPHLEGLEKLKKVRFQCRQTGKLLLDRGDIAKPLFKAGSKIMNCSLWGLFQSVSPGVNYKVGTALCKCRLCPNCQRVVAAKRRNGFLEWWGLNREALKPYFFYHLVLTVRHSSADGVRTGLYTPDLLAYFAKLRGTHTDLSGYERRRRSADWKHFVAGGAYSVEVKQGRDNSPHIHIHCLLVGNVKLAKRSKDGKFNGASEFMQHVRASWMDITGDSDNVFIEPVYYLNPDTKEKVYSFKGSEAQVERAVAECQKYTIKADASALASYSDEFLSDLLTFRNRYYSRFGCLSSNDKASSKFQKMELLRTDYQDLEQLTLQELARLINPETGEIIEADATQFVATPLRNMIPKPLHEPAPAQEVRTKMQPTGKLWPKDGSALAGTPILAPVVEVVPQATAEEAAFKAPEVYYEAAQLPAWKAVHQYRFFPYHEKQRAAIYLSRSIAADYNATYEVPVEVQNIPSK